MPSVVAVALNHLGFGVDLWEEVGEGEVVK
jgi:hypothetical protein